MKALFDDEEVKKVICSPGIYYLKLGGKDYVGSSKCLKDRLLDHKHRLISGNHSNCFIQNVFNKHGEKKCFFSILEIMEHDVDLTELLKCEKKWIDVLGPILNLKLDPETQTNSITQSKEVYQYTLDGLFCAKFPSTKEAERQLGISSGLISACARGQILQAKGYFWSYVPVSDYQYSLERSKWKWKAIVLKHLKTGKLEIFNNIASATRSILKEDDNFHSMCATLSAIAKRGKGTLRKEYTCFYLENATDGEAALKLGELLETPEMDNQQPS